jgi:hypothetical protein
MLFLLYINDLPSAVNTDNKVLLYADDTSMLVSGTNNDEIQFRPRPMLNSLSHWFTCNGLSINVMKTNSLPNYLIDLVHDKKIAYEKNNGYFNP